MFALRRAVAAPALRRGYAEAVSTSSKLKLSLVLPHQAIFSSADVTQVNIPGVTGRRGILANHIPTVEALAPGLVEVIESGATGKKFFISGGFCSVHPNSSCTINAVEGYDISNFDASAIKSNLETAKRTAESASSDVAKAEAKIEVEVLTALEAAVRG